MIQSVTVSYTHQRLRSVKRSFILVHIKVENVNRLAATHNAGRQFSVYSVNSKLHRIVGLYKGIFYVVKSPWPTVLHLTTVQEKGKASTAPCQYYPALLRKVDVEKHHARNIQEDSTWKISSARLPSSVNCRNCLQPGFINTLLHTNT